MTNNPTAELEPMDFPEAEVGDPPLAEPVDPADYKFEASPAYPNDQPVVNQAKLQKATTIAKQLVTMSDLQQLTELEVLDEDDKELGDLVRQEIGRLAKSVASCDSKTIPPEVKAAVDKFADKLGMTASDLLQIKLVNYDTLDMAVKALGQSGIASATTLILSSLFTRRAARAAEAIDWLHEQARQIKKKLRTVKGKTKISPADEATLKRIDEAIEATFAKTDHFVAWDLFEELSAAKPKRKKTKP